MRRSRRITTAVAAVALGASLTATGAQAAPGDQSLKADVTSGPFHLTVDAFRPAGTRSTEAVTGTFTAETSLAGAQLMDVGGPVTCLDVRGNRIGLFYPVDRSTPSLFAQLGAGIFIYLTVDGRGKATNVTFVPVPSRTTIGCSPQPALTPATGSAVAAS